MIHAETISDFGEVADRIDASTLDKLNADSVEINGPKTADGKSLHIEISQKDLKVINP